MEDGAKFEPVRVTAPARSKGRDAVTLLTEYLARASAAEADAFVREKLPAAGGTPWALIQRIGALRFGFAGTGPWVEGSMAGRVFGPNGEIRWTRDGAHYRLWWTGERQPAEAPIPVRYYLLGRVGREKTAEGFREPHLNGDLNPYYAFLCPGRAPGADERPHIDVVEYYPAMPPDGATDAQFESALNAPRVIAHRFVGVGLDEGEEDA